MNTGPRPVELLRLAHEEFNHALDAFEKAGRHPGELLFVAAFIVLAVSRCSVTCDLSAALGLVESMARDLESVLPRSTTMGAALASYLARKAKPV